MKIDWKSIGIGVVGSVALGAMFGNSNATAGAGNTPVNTPIAPDTSGITTPAPSAPTNVFSKTWSSFAGGVGKMGESVRGFTKRWGGSADFGLKMLKGGMGVSSLVDARKQGKMAEQQFHTNQAMAQQQANMQNAQWQQQMKNQQIRNDMVNEELASNPYAAANTALNDFDNQRVIQERSRKRQARSYGIDPSSARFYDAVTSGIDRAKGRALLSNSLRTQGLQAHQARLGSLINAPVYGGYTGNSALLNAGQNQFGTLANMAGSSYTAGFDALGLVKPQQTTKGGTVVKNEKEYLVGRSNDFSGDYWAASDNGIVT